MKNERDQFCLNEIFDLQYEAEVYEDNFGKWYLNIPNGTMILEMEPEERQDFPFFDVKPIDTENGYTEIRDSKIHSWFLFR